MKKLILFLFTTIILISCNKQPQQDCGTYPYCIGDYSIHPDNWLCGRLKPEPSPFDKNDTVVAMMIKYVYHSDMNGLTYFITRKKEMFSILDESGNRKESIELNDYKGNNFNNIPFILYPNKSIEDLPSEVISSDGVLIFDYEMEIHGGKTYEELTDSGDTIHMFELNEETYFDDVFYPI